MQPTMPEETVNLPQPQYGMPEPQSLEVTKYLSEETPFKYDENKEGSDDNVIEGELPPRMKYHFYGFLSKNIPLTYFKDAKDIERYLNKFELTKAAFIMSTPREEFTFTTMRHLKNLELMIWVRALRAWQGFERKQQNTSISMYGQMSPQMQTQTKPSIWNPMRWGSTLFGGGR